MSSEKKHLLVDNLDAQRPCRADDALDHRFQRRVSHLEALVLGFDLRDLIHGPDRHHPRRLVTFLHIKERNDEDRGEKARASFRAQCAGGNEVQRLKRRWTSLKSTKDGNCESSFARKDHFLLLHFPHVMNITSITAELKLRPRRDVCALQRKQRER